MAKWKGDGLIGPTSYWVRTTLNWDVWHVARVTNGVWEHWDRARREWVPMDRDHGQRYTDYVQRGELTLDRVTEEEAKQAIVDLDRPEDVAPRKE